jgi:hypothetical protein
MGDTIFNKRVISMGMIFVTRIGNYDHNNHFKIRHNEFINGLVFNWDFRIYS